MLVENIDHYLDEELMLEQVEHATTKAQEVLENTEKRQAIIDKVCKLCDRLSGLPIVGVFIGDIPKLCSMVQDYASREYREAPLSTIITILASLIYFASPVDLIPDNIPILGYVDDMTFINMIINTLHNDIERYYIWQIGRKQSL